jgi:hypothetical protein
MKTPYSKLSIERLENAVKNHRKALKKLKAETKPSLIVEGKPVFDAKQKKTLYLAEWRLKTAKKWLQKRIDERDMKNH